MPHKVSLTNRVNGLRDAYEPTIYRNTHKSGVSLTLAPGWGKRIEMLRRGLDYTNQADFAAALGFARRGATVSVWETESEEPDETTFRLMADLTTQSEGVYAWLRNDTTMPKLVLKARYTEGSGGQPSQVRENAIGSENIRGSGGGVQTEPAEGDPYAMLAQWMVNHWTKIAQKNELTGPEIIPLLEQELAWFWEHGYMESYDCTLDLIRSIRFTMRTGKQQGRNGNGDMPPAA